MDSPLAYSTAGEVDDEAIAPTVESTPSPPEAALPWPPRALYAIPVAKSFTEVGRMVSGADLRQSLN